MSGDELKSYLISLYAGAAQYDNPARNPVTTICNGIDGANTTENGVLGRIFAGVVAYSRSSACYVNPPSNVSETDLGWGWQVQFTLNIINFCEHERRPDEVSIQLGWARIAHFGSHRVDPDLTYHFACRAAAKWRCP